MIKTSRFKAKAVSAYLAIIIIIIIIIIILVIIVTILLSKCKMTRLYSSCIRIPLLV